MSVIDQNTLGIGKQIHYSDRLSKRWAGLSKNNQALTEGLCVVLLPELFIGELKYGPEIASH